MTVAEVRALVGVERPGSWTVLEAVGPPSGGQHFLVRCWCGRALPVRAGNLRDNYRCWDCAPNANGGLSPREMRDLLGHGLRFCSVCSEAKPTDEFALNATRAGGRHHTCRVCSGRVAVERRYGLPWPEWERMLIAQSGRCAICGEAMREPAVDHDHATGAVRALLCNSCNLALGGFCDDPRILRAAIEYLARYAASPAPQSQPEAP